MNPYPLKFHPIYKELIWGGSKLKDVLGKDFPPNVKIGESWELADLPDNKSMIINGELAGKTITEVLQKYPQQIIGKKDYEPPFGLLIKFIDAADVLSVQVHPDADAVKRLKTGRPKTECWYIIDAEPGACIYKGLKPGTTKQQFAQAIKDGNCAELLNKISVKPGQCHLLPAGTVHAISAGILIAEIQTPSDTTFRVFDWNRLQNGKPRQLHITQALESINFNQSPDDIPVTTEGKLAETQFFKIDKFTAKANTSNDINNDQMKVIIVIEGSGKITSPQSQKADFAKGRTILLPAEFKGTIEFETYTEYLQITI
ncbi:MAG: class I mannose-6-phosphate isomerase [Sedimentisphaerales bacterium]|nr:class I mannose-6-phosphate isomerase [Sedimentisphaerales bacterium]